MGSQLPTPEERARKIARDQRGFLTHVGSFLAVGLFFLIINLITDASSLWFFWPLLPWGVGLAIHGWNVYWGSRFDDRWEERRAQEILRRDERRTSPAPAPAPSAQGEPGEIMARAATLVDAMRGSARRIPKSDVRRQALDVCASADQVVAAIGDNPGEVAIARDFLNRYLTPAHTIITDYTRLATRNVPSASATLVQVEEHDLPLLHKKLQELYDRLHRGSLIDLEVAREMLSLDLGTYQDKGTAGAPRPVSPGDVDAAERAVPGR
jgi:hypothetical protein